MFKNLNFEISVINEMLKIKKQIKNFQMACCLKYSITFLFFIVGIFFISTNVSAFTLTPQSTDGQESDGTIVTTVSGSDLGNTVLFLGLFDVQLGVNIDTFTASDPTLISISPANWIPGHDYYIVGEADFISACYGGATYEDCLASGNILSQETFRYLSIGSSNNLRSEDSSGGVISKYVSYPPQVKIISPTKGVSLSGVGIIKYEAADDNDLGGDFEKASAGLTSKPVSIFYTDKVPEWNWHYSMIGPDLKSRIIDALPAIGSYTWVTKNLIPGVFYRIVIDALDKEGLIGEIVSELFTVDFTEPVFIVKSNPPAVRSGNVNISIDSSEDLAIIPKVDIVQNGRGKTPLKVTGTGSHFEGTYTVLSGYDGTARIYVSGTDLAGNIGTTTVSGGTFSVGINPPPIPVIISPSIKSITGDDYVDIRGTTRDDTEVILKVNGVDVSRVRPDSSGAFTFSKIKLEKVKNQGVNFLSVTARDANGTTGESATVEVKRNIPPTVSITSPINRQVISDNTTILAKGEDGNGDSLLYTYQIRKVNTGSLESNWLTIGDALPSSGFTWNATEADDGDYFMRVIADDSSARATSTAVGISIRNTLPFFRFENGRKTVTKESNVVIIGRALTSENLTVKPNITGIDYSLDGGKKWIPIIFENDGYASERKFSVKLPLLAEGTYQILWRVKDSRDLSGRASHTVIVDRTPPKTPVISSPREGAIISSSFDENLKVDGIQTTVTGTAEAGSVVSLVQDSLVASLVKAKTLPNGKYSFQNITLIKKGLHTFNVHATDEVGNKSPENKISVAYDNPPVITFVNPKAFHGVSGITKLSWRIVDADGDALSNTTVSYRKGGGEFTTLVKNAIALGTFDWDVSALPEANNYELKISTTDGIVPVSSIVSFSVDKTIPKIATFILEPNANYEIGGIIARGTATDNIAGIEFIEYALINNSGTTDKTLDWHTAVINKGYLGTQASFTIKYPRPIEDGNYTIYARSVDTAGNLSIESQIAMPVDHTAPRIGSFYLETNGVLISSDKDKILTIPKYGTSIFGVSLETDSKSASLDIAGQTLELQKNIKNGLWETSLQINDSTTSPILISAEDNHGNKVDKKSLGIINTVPRGVIVSNNDGIHTPVEGLHIRVLKLNIENHEFSTFSGTNGSLLNIVSDASGGYNLALPEGEYRIVIVNPGIKTVRESLTLAEPRFITETFTTSKVTGWQEWFQSVIDWLRN